MKKNEIVAVLDASGSMSMILSDSIGGFNAFVKDQRSDNPDDTLSLVFFNSTYRTEYENKKLSDVKDLDESSYRVGGMTALYDAVGSTIDAVGKRLAETPEDQRPEKVVFAILTDGEENSSREYDAEKVKGMIEHQRDKYSWEFIYLAATEAGLKDGYKMGIQQEKAITFNATSEGTITAYATMSAVTRSSKSM